ncbi:hypothetical protein F511_29032 [Dorcoceras hygrometricum]|uniref:Uncharacterized protein n=1 Tax=Dorcoceras hygrometricum TaxID=472368 RepID=A0A2Z7CUI5_9LAMI|nr:hypothetical protein F511_29032 [Dorcoceras hygrometricum]
MINGILQDYRIWNFQGEKLIVQSLHNLSDEFQSSRIEVSEETNEETNHAEMLQEISHEVFEMPDGSSSRSENYVDASTSPTLMESNVEDFYRSIEEGKQPLYAGCTEFSKLTFVVELFQLITVMYLALNIMVELDV